MRRWKLKLTKKQKERLKVASTWSGIALVTYELYMAMVLRRQHTRDVFNAALQRKTAAGKQLVVLGDPHGSFGARVMGPDYECADICIDVRGCAKCEKDIAADALTGLQGVASSSAVVFVSPGQLESAEDPEALLRAIERVAGTDVFIAPIHPFTLLSIFRKRRVTAAPPEHNYTEWRDLPWVPGPSVPQHRALPGG